MKTDWRAGGGAGFALIITLSLLALLVLVVLALSALVRVNTQVAMAAGHQTQARQNALLGLDLARGELQRHAGDDLRLTGMAGLAGVAAGQNATTRYWCGVWRNDGAFVTWLASGATSPTSAGLDPVELIAANTVGAAASTSANVEKEHVIAGRMPVTTGRYAYLVTDEGIKVGAFVPPGERADPVVVPAIGPQMLVNQMKLRTALAANAASLPGVLAYEQLGLLPSVTPSVLQDCFHYVTLTPRFVSGSRYQSGMINLNTASPLVWRCLLEAYNTVPGVTPVGNVTARGNAIASGFAAATAGKLANAPFASTAALSTYLATVFPPTGSPTAAQIMDVLGPVLTVRSDTFRIRGYGESLNPADPTRIEATAWCEAIVQRAPEVMPGFGRRFVITSFRWLGPDDI